MENPYASRLTSATSPVRRSRWRLLTIGLPAAVIALALLNGIVITVAMAQLTPHSAEDWTIYLTPVVAVLLALILGLTALLVRRWRSDVGKSVLWGALGACFLFLLLQAVITVPQNSLIEGDGTAFWGLAFIPTVYVGVPLLLIGTLSGFAAGIVASATMKKASAR